MVLDVFSGFYHGIVLRNASAQRAKSADEFPEKHIARIGNVADDQREQPANVVAFNGQSAVHVAFAELQVGIQAKIANRSGAIEPNIDRLAVSVAAGKSLSAGQLDAERSSRDQLLRDVPKQLFPHLRTSCQRRSIQPSPTVRSKIAPRGPIEPTGAGAPSIPLAAPHFVSNSLGCLVSLFWDRQGFHVWTLSATRDFSLSNSRRRFKHFLALGLLLRCIEDCRRPAWRCADRIHIAFARSEAPQRPADFPDPVLTAVCPCTVLVFPESHLCRRGKPTRGISAPSRASGRRRTASNSQLLPRRPAAPSFPKPAPAPP